ncbi:MAG: hypothetical protein ABSF03_04430 [Streptosporangiaceae bacterium]|jgi:hypothetical protein
MQAQPQHVHRRFQQVRGGAGGERHERVVRLNEFPVPVHGQRRVGHVCRDDLPHCLGHRAQGRGAQAVLGVDRRETAGQQQGVPVAQRHVELLG